MSESAHERLPRVICGMLFLGERPSWHEYGATLLIFGALGTVVIPRRR